MPIGLKHFLLAYTIFWGLLLGYLVNLAFRQKHLADELRALKDSLGGKKSN